MQLNKAVLALCTRRARTFASAGPRRPCAFPKRPIRARTYTWHVHTWQGAFKATKQRAKPRTEDSG
eukprot:14956753-Alexandrium_andersonii.AAC.1